jgi:hypothetical protein
MAVGRAAQDEEGRVRRCPVAGEAPLVVVGQVVVAESEVERPEMLAFSISVDPGISVVMPQLGSSSTCPARKAARTSAGTSGRRNDAGGSVHGDSCRV